MNLKLLKGYVLAAMSILILGAAAVLLVINLDRDWRLKVYYMDVIQRRAVWLLLAGAAGVVVFWTARKLLPRTVADLREGSHIRQGKQVARQLKDRKGKPPNTPT